MEINDIKAYAIKNRVPIIENDSLNYIIKYIKDNNYISILEIGTAIGYSSISLALSNDKISITTIEKDNSMYEIAKSNISVMNLENRINVISGDALDININNNGTIITDNLKFHGLVDDYKNITSKDLRELVGKIIKYIDFLNENKEYSTDFIDIGDGISVSKKVKINEDSSLSN